MYFIQPKTDAYTESIKGTMARVAPAWCAVLVLRLEVWTKSRDPRTKMAWSPKAAKKAGRRRIFLGPIFAYFYLFLPIFWLRARSSTSPPSADEKEVDEKEAFGPRAGRKFACHVG